MATSQVWIVKEMDSSSTLSRILAIYDNPGAAHQHVQMMRDDPYLNGIGERPARYEVQTWQVNHEILK
jgi:hypothetical protein